MGGMHAILFMMFLYENKKDNECSVRITACQVFNRIVANNPRVQNFATKAGAINLALLLEWDERNNPKMNESIISCLFSYLRSANFDGKAIYINKCRGLH